jgi:hypothetical protein
MISTICIDWAFRIVLLRPQAKALFDNSSSYNQIFPVALILSKSCCVDRLLTNQHRQDYIVTMRAWVESLVDLTIYPSRRCCI